MKLGIIGDAHMGCADYSQKRRADFTTAFTNAVEVLLANGSEAICLLGDVFDSQVMRRNVDVFADVVREIAPVLRRLAAHAVPVLAIAGNHEFGRGREAGELRVLEALGMVRLLRNEAYMIGNVAICGVPWHPTESIEKLGAEADRLRHLGSTRRVLLLHNFVHGSRHVPSHLWEVKPTVAVGFDRVFVGHHHDAEEVGPFTMPGATEVQNLAEQDRVKKVVVYDTEKGCATFFELPKTHPTFVVTYDVGAYAKVNDLFAKIRSDLERMDLREAFVCVRILGTLRPGVTVSRAEIVALLRGLAVFDRYVEVRLERQTKKATEAIQGATIDGLLLRDFGREDAKARQYIENCTKPDFGPAIVEEILS